MPSARRVHPADGVDEHAVAQRRLAEGERSTPNIAATDSRIRAPATTMSARPGSSPGTFGPAGGSAVADSSATTRGQLRRCELEAVVRPQRLGAGGRVGDAGDRLGRAGRRDGDLEPVLVDVALEVAEDARTYSRHAAIDVVADVAAGEEAVGEPDGAELEAAGGQRLAPLAEQQLGRAAADVDEEHPLVEHRHRLQHAEVDQPGLLGAGDDLDVDARLVACPVEEDVGVGRLAHGAGGDGAQRGAVAVGDAAHPAQAGDAAVDGFGRHLLHVAAAVPEPDDLLLPGQRLEAVAADGPGDDEVEAVGADVERGQDVPPVGGGARARRRALSRRGGRCRRRSLRARPRGSWRSSRSRCRRRRRSRRRRRRRARSGSPRRGRPARPPVPRDVCAVGVRDDVADPRAGQAVADQAALLAGQRAAERQLGRLAPGPAEHVADDEVAEAVVELACQRLVEEDLLRRRRRTRRRSRSRRPGRRT